MCTASEEPEALDRRGAAAPQRRNAAAPQRLAKWLSVGPEEGELAYKSPILCKYMRKYVRFWGEIRAEWNELGRHLPGAANAPRPPEYAQGRTHSRTEIPLLIYIPCNLGDRN